MYAGPGSCRSHTIKGKAHKPNEFGRLVRIDEVENGIVSGYEVVAGNAADTTSWVPALQHHQACFGKAPEMATGDRGFHSAANEGKAEQMGVKRVALPARGRLSAKRAQEQKQRWFRRALRWRAGIEATISTLKHPFSMARATYKGETGFQRYVGWSVITKNLDGFKEINDRFGHGAGDAVLVTVAQTMQLGIRQTDMAARMGGDEFALILPDTDRDAATTVLKKLLKMLEGNMRQSGWSVTFSIGAVTFITPPGSLQEMIKRADDVMFSVKNSGKTGSSKRFGLLRQ